MAFIQSWSLSISLQVFASPALRGLIEMTMVKSQPIGPRSKPLLFSMSPRLREPIIESFMSFGILSHSCLWYKASGGLRRAWCSLTLMAGFIFLRLPPVMASSWLRLNSVFVMVWRELRRSCLPTHTPSPWSLPNSLIWLKGFCDLGHNFRTPKKYPSRGGWSVKRPCSL